MVSEPNTGWCASEEVEPRRGVYTRRCASKDAGPQTRVDWRAPHRLEKGTSASDDAGPRKRVNCEIPHQLGRRTKHSLQGCGNLSLVDAV